jgi:hypothetical protein
MNRRHRGIRLEDHRPIVPLLDDYVLAGEIHAEGHVGCGLVLARKLSHASGTATDGSAVEALTAGIGSTLAFMPSTKSRKYSRTLHPIRIHRPLAPTFHAGDRRFESGWGYFFIAWNGRRRGDPVGRETTSAEGRGNPGVG